MRSVRDPRVSLPSVAFVLAVPAAAFAGNAEPVPGLGEMALRAAFSLACVIALIAALAFLARKFRAKAAGAAGRRVVSIDRLDLGGRREIRLLRVEDRLLLVGVTGERIALLSELPAGPVAALDDESGGLRLLQKLTNSP